MVAVGVEQPLFLHEDVLPAIPSGWVWSRSDSLVIQRKPGKLFDTKTVAATGAVPVLNQSENGVLGYHDEEPGVVASAGAPVVTFANHTCAIRLVKHPFSAIQNIFPKVGKQGVCDTVWFYYALLGRVRTNDYKGHHPLFRDALVPVPPLAVQRRIASILSAYDDLSEINTRRIAILEEMARRIYEEWFVRFRFPGHEGVRMVESQLGLVPEGWRTTQLDDLYRTGSGGTPSRDHPEYFGGDIKWVKTKELNDGFLSITEECITDVGLAKSSAKVFPRDTVLIAMYGATIGKLGILSTPAATNQACCAVVPKDSYFSAAYAFLTLIVRRQELIDLRAGAAQQNINQITIRQFQMLAPPSDVLVWFNQVVQPMLLLSECLQRKNATLRETRDLLLPRLISGELGVSARPEPEALAA